MFKYFTPIIAAIASLTVLLNGCSKNLDGMSIQEKSIHQPDRFKSDSARDKNRKPLEILNFSEIKPGMKVIDLFGGGGFYTELFNYIVGKDGKVYLQNNTLFLRFSKEEVKKRLSNNRLNNVIRLDSEFSDMQLPNDVDLIFIGLSYHDIYIKREEPLITTSAKEFFPQIYKALKPGGKIVIIDHAAIDNSGITTTAKLHRIDEQWTINSFESAGFKFVKKSDLLRNPKDTRELDIWQKKFYNKTDRFIHLYTKPVN